MFVREIGRNYRNAINNSNKYMRTSIKNDAHCFNITARLIKREMKMYMSLDLALLLAAGAFLAGYVMRGMLG